MDSWISSRDPLFRSAAEARQHLGALPIGGILRRDLLDGELDLVSFDVRLGPQRADLGLDRLSLGVELSKLACMISPAEFLRRFFARFLDDTRRAREHPILPDIGVD